jgi:hypothetical protein
VIWKPDNSFQLPVFLVVLNHRSMDISSADECSLFYIMLNDGIYTQKKIPKE